MCSYAYWCYGTSRPSNYVKPVSVTTIPPELAYVYYENIDLTVSGTNKI